MWTRVEPADLGPCLIYSSRHAKRALHVVPDFVDNLIGREVTCPFCELPPARIVTRNAYGLVIRDVYPVTAGHTLVIPIRHVGSFFGLRPEERDGLLTLLDQAKADLEIGEDKPDGYNIGINDGPAAGQTVPHMHIHLIPRRHGDRQDPRGGVRWVIPEKAAYWEDMAPVEGRWPAP